jgi:hypothetical protein
MIIPAKVCEENRHSGDRRAGLGSICPANDKSSEIAERATRDNEQAAVFRQRRHQLRNDICAEE